MSHNVFVAIAFANALIAVVFTMGSAVFIARELEKVCSYKRVGGMRFVRFGPLCLSFCLTSKPVRPVVQ